MGATWVLAARDLGTQSLFRVRYGGPKRDGGLRLILRLDTSDRFQLAAADVLGRALWSMELYDGQVLLVNHAEKTYCVAGEELAIPEVALDPLPVRALPNVLLGYLPVELAADSLTADDGFDFSDPAGRRWTGSLETGKPSNWMLWEGAQPVLWWTRQDKGGILSHRQGAQFRWKTVVREPLEDGFERLAVPDGYRRAACYESHL
ncbi:MAG: hypothetical protein EP299_00370 [Acidobacteria bacterium]|nr:MAG: hypothetical protein EP299_00370 [Acidobacteriota bacterium]